MTLEREQVTPAAVAEADSQAASKGETEQAGTSAMPSRYPLSVAQYEAMLSAGILTEHDKTELLEGQLYSKMTKNEPHVICSLLFTEKFPRLIPEGWLLSFENPVQTLESVPEPDVMVVRGKPRDYATQRIPADKIGLAVEISDTTLVTDRTVKLRIYARGGVPIYWIVNLAERQIEVFTQPFVDGQTASYQIREVFTDATTVPFILDGQEIARLPVADLLP